MTPDSIILLDPNARLDALIALMQDALVRAKTHRTEEAWDVHVVAWERLHAELMSQVDQAQPEALIDEADLDTIPDPFQVLSQPADTEV